MNSQLVRESFLDFFKKRDHVIVPSMSLIPRDDPSVLFTIAGMVQFKPFFTGSIPLPYKRAASIQKCLRLSDLDNVGKTRRHLTFFEMLGNFSFGDYFNEEAIVWAWEYLVSVLGIDEKHLLVSVLDSDDESYSLWRKKIGLSADRIYKLSDETNFWGPAGNSGPCGPCSEVYYDLGEKFSCGKKDCAPGCDCDRYIEIWNLVFPQFDQTVSGERLPLKNKGVDTGMGFERLVSVLQKKDTNFQTDLFYPIIEKISGYADLGYGGDPKRDVTVNIIADHARALTFGIGDGIIPSNEERGYVLRKLLRRALRLGRTLKIEGPFIYQVVGTVIDMFKTAYPDLAKRREEIALVVKSEEERFLDTLDKGLLQFEEISGKGKKISGADAFKLYDTYGFPLELTVEIAGEHGITVDEAKFYEMLEQARTISRTKAKFIPKGEWKMLQEGAGKFVGYETTEVETDVLRYNMHGKTIDLVLKDNPFYAESGGQVGDKGAITGKDFKLDVSDTYYFQQTAVCHCVLAEGTFSVQKVRAAVDGVWRKECARAHTATHLLHAALRQVLGEHARQEGSFVEPGRFRFDFTHFKPLSDDEMDAVEKKVNEKIMADLAVEKFYTNLDEARKLGAMALFGEKYGENVRVIRIDDFSVELCGGAHCDRTGEIGMFKIAAQESAAAGIRRIEAAVGMKLYDEISRKDRVFRELSGLLGTDDALVDRVNELQREVKELGKIIQENHARLAADEAKKIVEQVLKGKDRHILREFKNLGMAAMRLVADAVMTRAKDTIGILYEETGGKVNFIVFCGPETAADHPANKLIKEISKIWGGGGGGKPHLAEGGGADPKKLPAVEKYLRGLFK
jgi:alanyl-tRNA synthetase